MLPRRPLW